MSFLIILFTFSIFTLSRADYTWPDPTLDEIEHITHVQKGLFGSGILDQIPSCKTGIPQGDDSEQSPADWLRTAFHDVASYDAANGTGGLDASLQWETNRTENRGAHAFINTLQFMSKYHSIRTSMSDLIALAAYSAVGNCGGPLLTMKARRVDATGPAPEGRLPAPSDPTSTLIRKFANAGFNQREMIQMVACGHTLGGVHKESFPEIVGSTSFSDFDRTENKFDHRVASEYLGGTTKNPLVRALGGNNSDFKVFNSDGNSTIRAMSTPSAFAASCRVILQRMIDTVPASVTLSPPLAPQTVKPHRLQLELTNTGTLQLKGYIRIKIDGKGISGVKLIYQDRDGKPISDPIKTRLVTTQGGIGKGLEASFKFFEISPNTLTNGISGFVVSVTKSTGTKVIYDNNGHGYPVQDAIIVQQPQSCLSSSNANGIADLTVTAAIRKDIISQEPQMNIVIKSEMPDTLVPRLSVESVQMRAWKNETAGYVLYRGSYSLPASSRWTTFDVWTKDAQGTRYEDTFKPTSELSETCGEWQAMHRSHRRSLFNTGIERWSTRRIDHTKHARAHQHGLEYDSTRETPVNVDRTIPVRGHLSP